MIGLKQRIKKHEPLYWTNVTIYDEYLPIFIQKAGFDFVVIDGLNSIYDSLDKVAKIIHICNLIHLPVIYRSNNDDKLLKSIDLGADGVAWMNATTRESVRAFKDKLFFYPKGNRRPNPFTELGGYGCENFNEIKQQHNDNLIFWIYIEEHIKDRETMVEILSEEDIDIAYLGQFINESAPNTIETCKVFTEITKIRGIGVAGFHYQFEKASYQKMDTLKFTLQKPNVIGLSSDSKIIVDGFRESLERGKTFVELIDGLGGKR